MQLKTILILFSLFGCASHNQIITSKDDYQIISEIIVIKNIEDKFLNKNASNAALISKLKDDINFDGKEYSEFGDLRRIFSPEIIEEVFNKDVFDYLLNQQKNDAVWDQRNLGNVRIAEEAPKEEMINKISIPVYTTNNDYAIVEFSRNNYRYSIGNSELMLFQKTDGKWKYINSFFHSME